MASSMSDNRAVGPLHAALTTPGIVETATSVGIMAGTITSGATATAVAAPSGTAVVLAAMPECRNHMVKPPQRPPASICGSSLGFTRFIHGVKINAGPRNGRRVS